MAGIREIVSKLTKKVFSPTSEQKEKEIPFSVFDAEEKIKRRKKRLQEVMDSTK